MLKKIKIQNFKSLEDFEVEIKPLMLLFGQNSSGKSTFLKALMFLKANLFPTISINSKYNISKDVDLISYENIVNNNDVSKNILFEFTFEGKQSFPHLETLDKDYYLKSLTSMIDKNYVDPLKQELGIERDYESTRQMIEIDLLWFEEKNLLEFFDLTVKDWENTDQFTVDYVYDNLFEYTDIKCRLQIEFRKDKQGNDLHKIRFYDDLNNSSISFGDKSYGSLDVDSINIMNNDNLNEIFGAHIKGSIDSGNFPNIPGFEKLNRLNKESSCSKEEYHYVMKLVYNSYRITPYLLNGFLEYKHLPSVREIPKNIYLVNKSNGLIDDTQYYGLMNFIVRDQIKLGNLIAEKNKGVLNFDWLKRIIDLVQKFTKNELALSKTEFNELRRIAEIYSQVNDLKEMFVFIPSNMKTGVTIPLSQEQKEKNQIRRLSENSIIKMNIALKEHGFYDLFAIQFDANLDVAKLFIFSHPNTETLLSNASSGFIQFFPILIILNILKGGNFWYNKRASIHYLNKQHLQIESFSLSNIYIEQPELHLHPKLQCKVAEMLVDSVKSFNSENIVIIETHSEHIIRKIQVEIAKGNFDKNLLGVYYFDKVDGKTNPINLEIDEKGLFSSDWPNGFFDEASNLSFELLKAISNKN